MHAWLIAALVISWVLVFALAGALIVLIKQHGQLIMYQQDLDHRLEMSSFFEGKRVQREEGDAPPGALMEGLPVGTEAPGFALVDLEGNERTLEDYRGEPFVLAFFSETCGYCKDMAPQIGALDKDGRRLVLLSHGDADAHRKLAAEHGWHSDVLIEPEYDVMSSYQTQGTPSGYLIDAEGRIASPLALGGEPLLALLDTEPQQAPAPTENGHAALTENGHVDAAAIRVGDPPQQDADGEMEAAAATATALKTKDVSESKLVRDGLEAGTIAPNFVLKDLDGKAHSLGDYQGKRVLLVFSDVTCGPCEAMSPGLVELAERNRKKLQVIMISRGDVEENQRKREAFGYPFPVLLQKSWEISKLYGMFATPIGYLIDENGVIEKDVAVGPEPILELF
jgi:peroxiredoxin